MEGINETFYISHGMPMLLIDETIPARSFLKKWKSEVFQRKPSAILIISAHWDTEFPSVNIVPHNDTIYDFYGFPHSLYQVLNISLTSSSYLISLLAFGSSCLILLCLFPVSSPWMDTFCFR